MTVGELLDALEGVDRSIEVTYGYDDNWAYAYSVRVEPWEVRIK